MNLYEQYKPFRNYLRRLDAFSSLIDVWRYTLHVMENQPLPTDYAIGFNPVLNGSVRLHIHPWDLDLLSRELLLNAGSGGGRLNQWNCLAEAINHIRRIDEVISGATLPTKQIDILFELHRIAHRQFPWQTNKGISPLTRAWKVFGASSVDAIVKRELGMTMKEMVRLGMAVAGHFMHTGGLSTHQDYGILGITPEAKDAFFSRVSSPLKALRANLAKHQSLNEDWVYSWNPLEATPLVAFDDAHPDRVICPIPRYFLHRVSGGLFYDLVKSADFDNPFGSSFQSYIGEVLRTTCPQPPFQIHSEEPYYIGSNLLHGIDWLVSDRTGNLFIESKTKRLTVSAKTLSDTAALDRDLRVMAAAIAQTYRNVRDALDRKTKWIPNGLPNYPLILTLEDWFIFSPRVNEMLNAHINQLLDEAHISRQVLQEMPYTIASAHEFEISIQVMAQAGITSVMKKKTMPNHRWWSLMPFIHSEFKDYLSKVNWRLFFEDWDDLLPDRGG